MMRLAVLLLALTASAQDMKLKFPSNEWARIKPEDAGYSSEKLEVVRAWLKTQKTTAMHVSIAGQAIFEYGDVKRVSKLASIRKSILAMLYGKYVAEGKIDLSKTVEQLGLADVQPFLPIEKQATLYNLLTARSGIYHPTANMELTDLSPRRGSQTPGTYFQYQNWDFNAAGTAFEKLTGKDIFAALEEDLAKPAGMEDFDRAKQRKNNEMPVTRHPEYAMYLSARDMARVGLLMLSDGQWNGKRLMPKGWSSRITTLVTPASEIHPLQLSMRTRGSLWGYGMLWWVWDAPITPGLVTGPYQGAFSAMGANGQYITVLPAMNLVLAHKVDFDEDGSREISPGQFHAILQMLIESGCSGPCK
uniref:Beta-lactamase n=1 Tax=Solibacter usitatus (strain Ellin6076) TaxID=234267 RepID=Q025F2_SOLUE